MRINFEQLRTFLMVVRFGGVRRASERMHLSQPAVTARIQNLEGTLGVALFHRSAGGMTLTKRGEALLRYAEQYAQLGELIQRDVVDPAGVDFYLRLGVSETIVQSWLPNFIARLRQNFPKLEIEIAVDISHNLREALLNRALDLALLMGPISEFSVDNLELPDVPLAWYGPGDLALAGEEIFSRMPVVTYARNTRPFRELKLELFERYGPGVMLFPSSSLSACFRMVAAGLGVGALPEVLAGEELAAGRIRRFDPGWHPNPLRFTASYLAEPEGLFIKEAARDRPRGGARLFK